MRGEHTGAQVILIAKTLHRHSPRHDHPFLAVNYAAIPETLLEAELFGYERGAFTGAESRKMGKFVQADGGTLFLDEVGDMPLSTQVKLLRVLQDHTFQRLGGETFVECDVRIIAVLNASNGQLQAAANLLGISRTTLRSHIRKHRIKTQTTASPGD